MALATQWIKPGGTLILATFALDGPAHCSGLVVRPYDAEGLARCFEDGFVLEHQEREVHVTPSDSLQYFTWAVLRRER